MLIRRRFTPHALIGVRRLQLALAGDYFDFACAARLTMQASAGVAPMARGRTSCVGGDYRHHRIGIGIRDYDDASSRPLIMSRRLMKRRSARGRFIACCGISLILMILADRAVRC